MLTFIKHPNKKLCHMYMLILSYTYDNMVYTFVHTHIHFYTIRNMYKLKTMIVNCFEQKDAGDPNKVQVALRWCKKKITNFRVDERRRVSEYMLLPVAIFLGIHISIQVIGIKPYEQFPAKKPDVLARDIIRATKAPINRQLESSYIRNLALLVRA